MRWMGRLLFAGLLLAVGIWTGWRLARPPSSPPVQVHHTGLVIEQIRALADLVVLRVDLADVMECRIDGHVGGVKAALLVKGNVQWSTDLERARFEAVDAEHRTAVLVLAPPQAGPARLDHRRTRLFALSTTGLWQLVPDDKPYRAVLNQAYAQAQILLTQAAAATDLDGRARRQAQAVLGRFVAALGWHVTIRWSDRPSEAAAAAEKGDAS